MPEVDDPLRLLLGGSHESHDIRRLSSAVSAIETAQYFNSHARLARPFPGKVPMHRYGVANRTVDGLILEFGVARGHTINVIADAAGVPVYGFDVFTGLPEDWRGSFRAGHFDRRGSLPEVRDNVDLVIGLFDDTLPEFVGQHAGPVSYLHVDCDLYSSTKTIFRELGDRIVPGTMIAFDEYWNYPGWQQDEFKAFKEFVAERGIAYSYVGYVPTNQQVLVRID
jgi:hypothetical protein